MRGPRSFVLVSCFAVISSAAFALGGCSAAVHPAGVEITSAGECATCHISDYNATSSPAHVTTGFPTTCADCHTTLTWQGAVGAHNATTEATFPVGSGVHKNIECDTCHDSTLGASYATNSNCTRTCHTPQTTEGFDNAANLSVANWQWPNYHNGATLADFTTVPAGSTVPAQQFCRRCHPSGQDALPATKVHNTTATGSAFDASHNTGAAGSTGTCADCHSTAYDPATTTQTSSQRDFSEDINCGATCHEHQGERVGFGAHNEALFPITSGVHQGIACTSCHDTALGSSATNANCTATCHTQANTEGYNGMDGTVADSSITNWEWTGYHNGSTPADFTTLISGSTYPIEQFCRNCHPTGQDASATALVHNSLATGAQFSPSHNAGSTGATGTCADCHSTTYDPVLASPSGQRDFTQDLDCGATCHQHSGMRVGKDN